MSTDVEKVTALERLVRGTKKQIKDADSDDVYQTAIFAGFFVSVEEILNLENEKA